ncbi:hypothetical protein BHE74_00010406 [Ensete ventricosum]|nr:hypothetical protein BHE74_00010406 [Ensete ventricosum]
MGKAGARLLFPVFIHDAVLCSRSSLPFSPARRVDPEEPTKTPDDLGLGAVVVHGRHERGEAAAQVVHLPVEASYVVALENVSVVPAYPAAASPAGLRKEGLQLGDELIDLLLGNPRPPARHLGTRRLKRMEKGERCGGETKGKREGRGSFIEEEQRVCVKKKKKKKKKKKHYMEKGQGGPDVPPLFLTLVPLDHSLPTCHVYVKKMIRPFVSSILLRPSSLSEPSITHHPNVRKP